MQDESPGSLADAMPLTSRALEEGMHRPLHIGAQIYVAHRGRTVADAALGDARPGVPMTRQTLMLWLSASKPVTAIAIAQLLDRQKLHLDDPVALHLPEFAQNGKQAVTIRHILTHTAGFRWLETGWPSAPWEQIIASICAMPLEPGWEPGQRAGYHINTSWFILAELVQRLDGRHFPQYVRDEIFLPLGMTDSWIGMPQTEFDRYADRIGIMQQTEKLPPTPLPPWDTPDAVTHCRPAANGYGPIRELGLFYLALLNGGALPGGPRILSPATVHLFTTRQRIGLYDQTFRHKIDWGLGFILNSNRYGIDTLPYGFGPYASEATFGHNGSQSSSAFADPENDLVVALVCNGTPGEAEHQKRMRSLHAAIYQDLNLAQQHRPK